MSYTFRVIFEGICAFVPDKPFFEKKDGKWKPGDPPKEVTVLLPQCQISRAARWKDAGIRVVREPHWSVVTVEASRLMTTGCPRPPDLKWHGTIVVKVNGVVIEKETEWASFLLQREKVQFVPSDPVSLSVETKIPANPQVPDERIDGSSLWWLPRFTEISSRDRLANQRFKPVDDQEIDEDLAAAVEVKAGALSVVDFNRDARGRPQSWAFTHPTNWLSFKRHWMRPIGNTLGLLFEGQNGPLKVVLERGQVLSFEVLGDAANPVQVFVSNMEADDRLLPVKLRSGSLPDRDPDFEEFYALSSSSASTGPVPNAKASPAGPVKTPCSPGGYDGWKL